MPDDNGNSLFLEPHKVTIFGKNLDLVPQQKRSRLVNHVEADLAFMEKGDRYTDETMGTSEPQDVLQDIRPTPGGKIDKFRRLGFFKGRDDGKFVGTLEKAEQLVDPTNPTVRAMGMGRERKRDRDIIDGILGSAWEVGKDGDPTKKTFPTAQQVAVNDWDFWKGKADGGGTKPTGAAGLSVPKLRKAKTLLDGSNIDDMGQPCIAYEEEDLQNILTSLEAGSRDYDHAQRIENGESNSWKGLTWVKVNKGVLPVASNVATLPIWYPGNIYYKERPLVTLRVNERADMSYRWHAFYEYYMSVLRRFDVGVVKVLCDRSV